DNSVNNSTRQTEQDFLIESNYFISQVLRSGKVIFGDPVSTYLTKIKDQLLKDDPETREAIRIYTVKSKEVNAFTTDNGIVLVTTGLVAQVENEAELAFILAHEVNHYIHKHSMNEYVEARKMEHGEGVYKSLNQNDVELQRFTYSREKETEADETGLELYLKSNYSIKEIESVFDVLLYSYLPFDEVVFKKSFFESADYVFPPDYFLEETKSITAEEDYDDSKSTHPNIKARKENILEKIEGQSNADRKKYLISESEFQNVKKIC